LHKISQVQPQFKLIFNGMYIYLFISWYILAHYQHVLSTRYLIICFIETAVPTTNLVAFTEGQTAHLHLTKGEILTFNKVITDIGSGIGSDGIFTCATPGLYAFHFYSLTRSNGEIW